LAGGFLLALAHRRRWFGGCSGSPLGLHRPGQAGLEHQRFLFAGVATGFGRERIIVFADDVNFLALLLGRPAAQGLQLGAVIPVGTPGFGAAGRLGRAEAGAPGC
jgi:hypothetical protein